MTEQPISFVLPKPWAGETFQVDRLGNLSFLVGPNGSGKSRFADALKNVLPNARLLGTDRLEGMGRHPLANTVISDHALNGYQKNQFHYFKQAGNLGSGLDAFIILEERPDIRVIVEATLSSLFNRDITLEWDSGNLVPMARLSRTGEAYRIDREECHGIRELLVLLTHLHNDQYDFLIIDEPELNLHPQFQAFFMQEVRKIAGPRRQSSSQKCVVLITHSPFILDLRSMGDMEAVYSFSADHQPPKFLHSQQGADRASLASLVPRLNVHHKQLFFADNPIFVEGISDAQLIETIQERRKVSITAAGSCLIDVGGCEELTKYVELCVQFGKRAYFLFDLDSLYLGSLRKCLRNDGTIGEFLADLGLGSDFGRYCGELDRELTEAVRLIEKHECPQGIVAELVAYFERLPPADAKKLARQRVAVLVEIAANRDILSEILGLKLVTSVEGRLRQVQAALGTKNIFLLPGGALEHYLPLYSGDRYALNDSAKKTAVAAEVELLSTGSVDGSLAARYGELFKCIEALPAKPPVDVESVLRTYVGNYVHQLQGLVLNKPDWDKDKIISHFASSSNGLAKLITLVQFARPKNGEFEAVLEVSGKPRRLVDVSHETNAGMHRFSFRVETS